MSSVLVGLLQIVYEDPLADNNRRISGPVVVTSSSLTSMSVGFITDSLPFFHDLADLDMTLAPYGFSFTSAIAVLAIGLLDLALDVAARRHRLGQRLCMLMLQDPSGRDHSGKTLTTKQ